MPKYNFTWNNFDKQTILEFAQAMGCPEKTEELTRKFLIENIKRPNETFVKEHRQLVQSWLFDENRGGRYLRNVVKQLIHHGFGNQNYQPTTVSEFEKLVMSARNTVNFQKCLKEALILFGNESGALSEDHILENLVPAFFQLQPESNNGSLSTPREYQVHAWDNLDLEFAQSKSSGVFCGFLVMPTGSGKTFTAVRWLLENIIDNKQKVLWLAHRHFLIEQAAVCFYNSQSVLKNRKTVNVRLLSTAHAPANTFLNDSDDIVLSMPSLLRNEERRNFILENAHRYFIVIDEAHHAGANQYEQFISALKEKKTYSLLGLTATPTRTSERERPVLAQLFNNKFIDQQALLPLCEQGYLAWPITERSQTNYTVDDEITEQDEKRMRLNELGPDMAERLIHDEGRNAVIVQRYLDNKDRYGKTLVFAVDVEHAHLLRDAFNDAFEAQSPDVRAEYVASYRILEDREIVPSDKEILNEFRDQKSGLNVLINVEKLTEGLDIPEIDTVFLARPTNSEILCRQMIGRALRRKNGGDNVAYLVSFTDHWQKFRDWADPFSLVPDIEAISQARTNPDIPVQEQGDPGEEIPWAMISEFARFWRQRIKSDEITFDQVIEGWYVIDSDDDDSDEQPDNKSCIIPVYSHQKYWWERFFDQAKRDNFSGNLKSIAEDCFADCDLPAPSMTHILNLIAYLQAAKQTPPYHEFKARKESDPRSVADFIRKKDMRLSEKMAHLQAIFALPLTKAVFRDFTTFEKSVDAFLRSETDLTIPSAILFDDADLRRNLTPAKRDLQEIFDSQVKPKAEIILEVKSLQFDGQIDYTRRNLKSYWGKAFQTRSQGKGLIRINRLLNHEEIDLDILEFVLWHEYLHLFLNKEGHSENFRALERKWPNFAVIDGKLDRINEEFAISYL